MAAAALDGAEHKVLREEMGRIGARPPLSSFGIWMLGPALLKFGNEAQKKEPLAEDRRRPHSLVPGLFRAECGLRSGFAADARGKQR